jgi:hypothetical protein
MINWIIWRFRYWRYHRYCRLYNCYLIEWGKREATLEQKIFDHEDEIEFREKNQAKRQARIEQLIENRNKSEE